jgi:2-polyprenyl-6-methoxyphenol hydroxylase-like FAD-dependent oxidoreductase
MRDPDVLVVGAGPVGMVAALTMARAGLAVQVIDEQHRRAGHSYAVGLHPRSVLLLDQLGVLDSLLPHGQQVDAVTLVRAGERRRVPLSGLVGGGAFALALAQWRLEAALEAALAAHGVPVRWSHRLADLDGQLSAPEAIVERLGSEGAGYSYAVDVTVVDQRMRLRPRLIVGADGHRSRVAARLGIAAETQLPAQTFAAVELRPARAPAPRELQLLLGEQTVDAVWPLSDGWVRGTFEVIDGRFPPPPRRKERTSWWITGPDTKEQVADLIAGRAEWLRHPAEIGWTACARFERRVAPSWGRERVWLLGDAAHLASPLAAHSLNRGLHEADELAGTAVSVLGGAAGEEAFAAWAERSRTEWRSLLGDGNGAGRPSAVAAPDHRLAQALPATGEALRELLLRIAASAGTGYLRVPQVAANPPS